MRNEKPLRYPGDYYDSVSRELFAHVRMFIGRCVDTRDVVVWFIDSVDKRAGESDSLLRTSTEVDFIQEVQVPGIDTPMVAVQFPTGLKIAVVRAAVSKHVCTEIPPRPKPYTTVAGYIGPPPPRFRTDCNSPSFADVRLGPGQPGKSLAYRDKQTGVLLYVESDGRHLAAISPQGELLWVRDTFVDQNLCPYRTARPIIVYVGPTGWSGDETSVAKEFKIKSHVVEIRFDSSQFGVVDINTGDFFFAGQN